MRQLILRGISGALSCIALSSSETSLEDLRDKIHAVAGVPADQQRLVLGGRNLTQDVLDGLSGSDVVFVSLSVRVVGGKGGFGSLLRGGQSGPGAKKITNFGSMRDLQGRRIKDVVRYYSLRLLARRDFFFVLVRSTCFFAASGFCAIFISRPAHLM